MRNCLFATASLAFVSSPAMAADEKMEPAWSVGVAGYMQQWVGVSDFDTVYDKDGKNPKQGVADVQSDSEFFVNAKIETDNGLTFRGQIQVEGNGPGNIDESYVAVSGGFGDLRLGAEDDVHSSMHYGEQDVGVTIAAGDVNKWLPIGSGFNTAGWKADRKGIAYYSPRMQGLQIGAAWAGSTMNEATGGISHNDEDSWSVGVNYQGEMAGTTLGVSLGHWNAGTTGEQTVDASGRNHLCGLTRKGIGGATTDGTNPGSGAGFAAFGNAGCDAARNATTNVDTEKGTHYLGGTVGTPDGNGPEDHFVPATSMAKMADDATFTNLGVRVGFGSFGFNFALAQSDTGAYKVMKTPLYYQLWDGTNTAANTNPTAAQLAATARQVAHVATGAGAATTAVAPTTANSIPRTVPKGTPGAISGADFNWNDKKMDGLTCPATGTGACNDAAAANLVPEHTESVVKDMAGESTLMSAGVVYNEGPLGVSLHWSQESREDDTKAETVMLSTSYTLGPGVAWKSSIFQAEDDGAKTFDMNKMAMKVDGTAFVTGIAISF